MLVCLKNQIKMETESRTLTYVTLIHVESTLIYIFSNKTNPTTADIMKLQSIIKLINCVYTELKTSHVIAAKFCYITTIIQ